MVPVVRHAEARDLWSSAAEVARLAEAARAGKATREELGGSTITITSLGRAGRHRHHAGDQPPRRSRSSASTASSSGRSWRGGVVVAAADDEPVVVVRPPRRRRRGRGRSSCRRCAALLECPATAVRGVGDEDATSTTLLVDRRRPRRLRRGDPRRPAGHRHRAGRRRAPRRHLPQHRLHSVEGADPRRRRVRARVPARAATRRSASALESPRIDLAQTVVAGRTASSPASPAASRRC